MSIELKIRPLNLDEIARAVQGSLVKTAQSPRPVRYISTDSRDTGEDILFFALRGERFDGHTFAATAVKGGATCLICSTLPEDVKALDCTVILVEDTTRALGALASYYRSLADVCLVAVTGSVGKTTTKEFIYSVLSETYPTHKTEGNFNNHIGLPLTLFALAPHHRAAVLEMGMSARGEIAYLTRLARPDVAVITNVGTSHLEHLGTRENIAEAKMEIIEGLSHDGLLLINGDEPLLQPACARFPRVKTFSRTNSAADFSAAKEILCADSVSYELTEQGKASIPVRLPVPGAHNVYNSLVAYAVGRQLGMEDDAICRGLLRFRGAAMRQNVYSVGGIRIIEDCYNASPESMRASIDVLTAMERAEGGRYAALLGDMLELGERSAEYHVAVGEYAAQHGVELLFAYGDRAEDLARGAGAGGLAPTAIHRQRDKNDPLSMAQAILATLRENDVLLVKASRGVAAENVLKHIKELKK
ncbi:MAG: UDP-N-acetylmuramoyl-tripeptide--D-alanyl-D-alanine ligase [Clostridia bacterium]|nr:UDP-N-acetylmuramoyl-tripeptide--D-alanyl-D-alanine ligase [Clostridia bacterium]